MLESVLMAVILGGLLVAQHVERTKAEERWSAEREALLQRIQAPEQATIAYATDTAAELAYPPEFENDVAYAEVAEKIRRG